MKKMIGIGIVLTMLAVAGPAAATRQSSGTARVPEKVSEPELSAQPDRAVVPLSDPAKPARVEVSLMRGGLIIKGYEGKEVIVEARIREKAVGEMDKAIVLVDKELAGTGAPPAAIAGTGYNWAKPFSQEKDRKERSHEGMKLITAAVTGLHVEEEDNVVTISTDAWKYAIDMTIQVPASASLQIGRGDALLGQIVVENVGGDIEIQNANGPVTLRNVSGNIVANTVHGDIEAVVSRVAADKPLAFSTMNGDIDVTFPADLKATVKMKTRRGNVYSDFDVVLKQAPEKIQEVATTDRGRYRIAFDKGLSGAINGGGQEISFTSYTGNIFIRKKK